MIKLDIPYELRNKHQIGENQQIGLDTNGLAYVLSERIKDQKYFKDRFDSCETKEDLRRLLKSIKSSDRTNFEIMY